jgi:hypothetical protein
MLQLQAAGIIIPSDFSINQSKIIHKFDLPSEGVRRYNCLNRRSPQHLPFSSRCCGQRKEIEDVFHEEENPDGDVADLRVSGQNRSGGSVGRA